ncbi:hypothetical protein ACOSP6_09675 [Tenacibaculum sp. MEBiC06402]|uniref:hypothetical protein n=1 Tax=unclassified Tenacibaculum TaxID=2635139 RepID=UPI003B9C2CB7
MKKKIIIGFFAFIIGIIISQYSYSFLRELIQNIFLWSTSNRIKFIGKNFHLFGGAFYSLSVGFSFLILILDNLKKTLADYLKKIIITLLIFGIIIVGFSSLDANLKIVECTACDDGIRKLRWNEINYGLILGLSAIIAIIPSLIRIIKRIIKPAHNKVYN